MRNISFILGGGLVMNSVSPMGGSGACFRKAAAIFPPDRHPRTNIVSSVFHNSVSRLNDFGAIIISARPLSMEDQNPPRKPATRVRSHLRCRFVIL